MLNRKCIVKITLVLSLLNMLISLTACSHYDDENAEPIFFIENRDAIMPVWVRGNPDSDTYLLILHGGPGMGSFIMLNGFAELEKSYKCIYWDQRGAGSSLGNPSEESFTIEQHVEDLELLVKILEAKYSIGSLFLVGHSWGGALGTAYLLNENNQEHITGWIDIAGGHNTKRGHRLSREMVIDYAKSQVDSDNDRRYWKKALEWYDENSSFNGDNFLQHDRHTVKANGVFADQDSKPDKKEIFSGSPYSVMTGYLNCAHSVRNTNFFDIDMSKEMQTITVPSLIIWGKKDMVMPPILAEEAYESLGTPRENIEPILYLENSAHYPFDEERALFTAGVEQFVNKYQ